MLMQKIEKILEKNDFEYCEFHGCFDIFAKKRRDMMLLKVLSNVDSFQFEQANNLKILSRNLNAFSCLIGTHTRYEALEENIIYERFDIPTFTVDTFENILDGNPPCVYRTRRGLFVEVDPSLLKKSREKNFLTQEELAKRVGVTKKFIYEHEHKKMKAMQKIIENIEKILNEKISVPFNLKINISNIEENLNEPRTSFEKSVGFDLKKIGFKIDFIYQTPFNIIAKEKMLIFSKAEENEKKIRRNLPNLIEFSNVSNKPVLLITKEKKEYDLPSLQKKELKELSTNDLERVVKKW